MIYFIRDESTQHIKIGYTAGHGEKRLRDLQTGCPGQLMLLLHLEGLRQHETAWHKRFASARERGEWFRPVPELRRAIEVVKVSQMDTVKRVLKELQKEQEEFKNSGRSGWSAEEIKYLRVLQWEEERESNGGRR